MQRTTRILLALLSLYAAGTALAEARFFTRARSGPRFEITFERGVSDAPFTGRVFVVVSTGGSGQPKNALSMLSSPPIFAMDVAGWKPGETLAFEPDLSYPHPLAELPAGEYRAQAVMDLHGWSRSPLNGAGSAYSGTVDFEHTDDAAEAVELHIRRTVKPPKLRDSDDLHYVRLRSRLLSDFHKREVSFHAAVKLPGSYADDAERRYPTIYVIPGFGGGIEHAAMMLRMQDFSGPDFEIITVFLDPNCPTGHHVFADSANNGPWGTALVEELIPHLEQRYRIIPEAAARYVTGHSSGGWSSLWLQVAYPDHFGGVWSTSPDPVDFTAFQLVDIYDPKQNNYLDADGDERPVGRGIPVTLKSMSALETVLGRGGQLQSFEAVFSPRGADGRPMKLWDRTTGNIDPQIAKAWRKYDIRHLLESNWEELGPKLRGKLHLYCGERDTFYLDRAFVRLRDALERLNSDAYVELIPGAGHSLPPAVHNKIASQVAEQFRRTGLDGKK